MRLDKKPDMFGEVSRVFILELLLFGSMTKSMDSIVPILERWVSDYPVTCRCETYVLLGSYFKDIDRGRAQRYLELALQQPLPENNSRLPKQLDELKKKLRK